MSLSTGSRRFLAVLVVVVAAVGAGLWFINNQLAAEADPSEPIEFTVEEGSTAADVAAKLQERDVVKNALAFRLVARSQNLDANLRAGTYELETNMSVRAAVDALQEQPEPLTNKVTVREGLSVPLTLESLAEQTPHSVGEYRTVLDERLQAGGNQPGVLQLPTWLPDPSELPSTVRHPFEGMLFPETYRLDARADPQAVLQRMIDQLDAEMQNATEAVGQPPRQLTRYDALIIASLIERESRVVDERPEVSAVIHNRLQAGMPLQIDATVLYALGRHEERVLNVNTEVDSPYNTYETAGLPPSPIAGFSASALRAALEPADTQARYYVLSAACDGTHVFARTLQQHQANVADYRQAGRCRSTDDG